jgi:thiazole synthase
MSEGGIRIQVNGKERRAVRGATVTSLLADLDLQPAVVVVERNLEILDRSRYDEVVLEDGDRLELVHFVGGG